MASSWHVPVHDSTTIDMEDAFTDELELTFPPSRYFPLFYAQQNVPKTAELRRNSSRERDRLYKELVGHEPYKGVKHLSNVVREKGAFHVKLDVKHYRPEEVTLKVEGLILEVTGKHRNETEHGFESCEFQRKYTIPDDVDVHSLTSNISPDGVLCIDATRKRTPQTIAEEEGGRENFVFELDVEGYRPDEISIRVNGRDLVIHGETKDETPSKHGVQMHHRQFTRQVSLPSDIDTNLLSSRYSKDAKLTIEAPRIHEQEIRHLAITEEN